MAEVKYVTASGTQPLGYISVKEDSSGKFCTLRQVYGSLLPFAVVIMKTFHHVSSPDRLEQAEAASVARHICCKAPGCFGFKYFWPCAHSESVS